MEEPGNIPSRHEMVAGVRDTVINIWTSASIPILTPEGITYKINKIIDRYIGLKKSYKRGHKRPKYMAEVEKYKGHLNTLLDISACKCDNFKLCKCAKDIKVPKEEQRFILLISVALAI